MRLVALIAALLAGSALADIGTSSTVQSGMKTTPFSATSITGTATSTADKVTGFSGFTLEVVWSSGITGSPATCTLQPQRSVDGSNFVSWGSALSLTPASSTTQMFDNANPASLGQQIKYVYACGTYPTAGTFTVTALYTIEPNTRYVQQPTAANLNATVNVSQLGGTNTVTGGVNGTLAIGGTVATNVAPTQNPVVVAGIAQATGANPATGTSTRTQQVATDVTGNVFTIPYGPNLWSCTQTGIGTTLTQCQAAPAAGFRAYVTDIVTQSTTSTGGTYTIKYGTGTNCVTGTTTIFGAYNTVANTVAPSVIDLHVPLVPPTANAICVLGVVTNTTTFTLSGYIAP